MHECPVHRCRQVFVQVPLLIHLVFFLAASLHAQETFDFSGGEEARETGIPIHGRFSLESARQLEGPGRWVRLGPSLDLVFDTFTDVGQFYFEGTGRFNLSYRIEGDSGNTREDYEFEPILRELYWKKNLDRFTLSAGKLIDDPSVMDLVQIVDKISVVNRAEAFFAEPEEIKQGQNMIKLAYYPGNRFDAGFIFVPYPAFDRITEGDHPYALVKGEDLVKTRDRYDPEWCIQAGKQFSRGKIFGYAGRFNTRSPLLTTGLLSHDSRLYKFYEHYWSAGGAFTLAAEPFLLKMELAYNFNKPLQRQLNGTPSGYLSRDQVEAAAGTDLNLGNWGMLTLECGAGAPLDWDDALAVNRTAWQGAAAWSNDYLNDKLNISVTTLFQTSFKNRINRFQLTYFFTDTLSVRLQYTRFSIGQKESDYGFMDDYDRVDLCIDYDFNLGAW